MEVENAPYEQLDKLVERMRLFKEMCEENKQCLEEEDKRQKEEAIRQSDSIKSLDFEGTVIAFDTAVKDDKILTELPQEKQNTYEELMQFKMEE